MTLGETHPGMCLLGSCRKDLPREKRGLISPSGKPKMLILNKYNIYVTVKLGIHFIPPASLSGRRRRLEANGYAVSLPIFASCGVNPQGS